MAGKMVEKKIRSALPLYIAAGAFLVCAAVLPVYSLPGFLGACAVAAGAYFLSDKKIPPRVVMVPAPEDPFATGEEALDAALEKARDDLEKLEVLNARIPAAALSAQISRMEKAGAAILQQVREHPEKGRDIRKFVTYYLPTAVKILTTYADLSASGAGGENAKSLMSDVEKNAGTIASAFEAQLDALFAGEVLDVSSDIAVLDKMYEMNLVYFKELTMYILAGKKKLAEVRANELPALIEKAKKSGLPEDAQAAKDLDDMCTRFEKKLYDLELTRNISVQMSPQIRLIQSNDTMMAEKIQTSIVNTIPLWKSQMVLALGLAHSQQAIEAQRAVTDMTNELLKKNAATLKQGTIAAAKESERGIVDIETLQQTNRSLIETLDEVVKIQNEGREKRAAAETELGRIEGELKAKLLEIAR